MQLRSLEQLEAYARTLADAKGESALERWPSADVRLAVNRGITKFRRVLTAAGGGTRFLESVQDTTTGAALYALPVDFASLWAIELYPNSYGGSDWLTAMDPIEAAHEHVGYVDQRLPRYRLVGGQIEVLPAPVAGRTIRIWYVPTVSDLAASSDMVECFEEYVAMFAASEFATGDRAFDLRDRLRADCKDLEPSIRTLARQRDMANPAGVRDIWSERTVRRRDRFRRYFP